MKVLRLITILFLAPLFGLAQDATTSKVNERLAQLKAQGVDTIACYYTDYADCVGATKVYNPDSCEANEMKHLIWKVGKQSYIQRFDECNTYAELPISPAFITTLSKNYKKVKEAKLKPMQFIEIVKNKKAITDVVMDQACQVKLEIYTPSGVLVKNIDKFATDTRSYDGKNKNVYYKQNQQSILLTLMNMANVLTKKTASTKKAP